MLTDNLQWRHKNFLVYSFFAETLLLYSSLFSLQIKEAVMQIESALEARAKFLEALQLQPMAIDPINSIRNSVQCLQNLSNSFDALKVCTRSVSSNGYFCIEVMKKPYR